MRARQPPSYPFGALTLRELANSVDRMHQKAIALAALALVLFVVPALAAPAANFTASAGNSGGPYTYVLEVAFAEAGVGTRPVIYRVDAAAEFLVGQCDGSTVERLFAVSSETTVTPARGRASGQLTVAYSPSGTAGCPPPPWNEDGTIDPTTPIPQPIFLGWVNITVTSGTGRVLELPDAAAAH